MKNDFLVSMCTAHTDTYKTSGHLSEEDFYVYLIWNVFLSGFHIRKSEKVLFNHLCPEPLFSTAKSVDKKLFYSIHILAKLLGTRNQKRDQQIYRNFDFLGTFKYFD